MEEKKQGSPLAYLISLSSQGGWLLAITVILAVASGVLAVVPLWALYRLIALLAEGVRDGKELVTQAIIVGIAGIGHLLCFMSAMLFSHVTAFRILRDLRYSLAKKLLELPLGWFTKQSTGDTRKLFTEDIEKIELFIAHHIPDITRGLVIPLTTLALLFHADWRLALISMVPLLLAPLFLKAVYANYNRDMGQYFKLLSKMNGTIIEYIRGMSLVRAFNRTAESFGTYRHSVNEYFSFWKKWTLAVVNTYGGFTSMLESGALWMLAAGGFFYLQGMVSLPAFLLALIVGPAWVASVKGLYFMMNLMSMNFQGVTRLRAVLDQPPLKEPATPLNPPNCEVAFKDVDFSYDEQTVLKDINFVARPGTLTAFVGPSGAGKSTAALLAARFYDPMSGHITMGGNGYQSIGSKLLMKKTAICFQEAQLFKGTIEDNIRMGNKTATREKVIAAAKAARAHEFIEELPGGYDMSVSGDRVLSGGQIQRIAIARAMLKDAPLVILDEATSYADPENERLIQEGLNELLKDRSVIVVAHRLATLRHADRILVFEKGQIVQEGTFDELEKAGGTFGRLWEGAKSALRWDLASIQSATNALDDQSSYKNNTTEVLS